MRGGCTVESPENRYPVMDRIMLRFRPIAPKPTGGEDVSAAAELERRNTPVRFGRRTKRKYVRARGRRSSKRKTTEESRSSPPQKSGIEDVSSPEKGAVTLKLFPEPERSESDKSCHKSTAALNFTKNTDRHKLDGDGEVNYPKADAGGFGGAAALVNVRSVINTWIVVESVTDSFVDNGEALGLSDGEKIKCLQGDTCPGFVSDGYNKVVWVNEAYRKMVAEGEAQMVWLVVKEELPYFAPSFTCRVRMVQQTKHGQKWNKIVPCDVWGMEYFAGFAWKLDVKTALSLGI